MMIRDLDLVFIVGCQRTGTTLVGNLLGSHPRAFLIDEPDGLYPWMESIFSNRDDTVSNELFLKCCISARNSYSDPNAKCDDQGILSSSITHLVLKAPNLTYFADKIAASFPGSSCVFLYRDIRDVVVSMSKIQMIPMVQNQLLRIKKIPELSAQYRSAVLELEDSNTPPHIKRAYVAKIKTELRGTFNHVNIQKLEVAYEELVQQPELWKKKVFQHVGLTTDQELTPADTMIGWGPGLNHRLDKINTFSIGQWKHYLTKAQENDVWEISESLMTELGYKRTTDYPSIVRHWQEITTDNKHQPVIATGRGGSGTRLLSRILQNLNIFLGNKINATGDSLEWVSLIYKIAIETTQSQAGTALACWNHPLQETAAEILMAGNWSESQPWGWKLPETMLALPVIFDTFPQGKLIHLVRHPVDSSLRRSHMTSRTSNLMGKSALQAAYRDLGWSVDKINTDPDYKRNAAGWLYQVGKVSAFGAKIMGPAHYLEIRYEDLCSDPVTTMNAIAKFLNIQLPEQTIPIDIDQDRLRHWTPPDPRASEVWDICGDLAKEFGYQEY